MSSTPMNRESHNHGRRQRRKSQKTKLFPNTKSTRNKVKITQTKQEIIRKTQQDANKQKEKFHTQKKKKG